MRNLVYLAALVVLLSLMTLASRKGGWRRQSRLLVRRLRIALLLAGIFVVVDAGLRLLGPSGWGSGYAPLLLAGALGVAFVALAQDPKADL